MMIPVLAVVLIVAGVTLLVLGTVPMKNTLENDTLTVHYMLGKESINISGAHFLPVPDEVNHNIIRIGGTSIGKRHSGNFMNTKTKTKYKFYLTGNGEKKYFELGDKKYLVDGIQE